LLATESGVINWENIIMIMDGMVDGAFACALWVIEPIVDLRLASELGVYDVLKIGGIG
jgi:hypothetical protein